MMISSALNGRVNAGYGQSLPGTQPASPPQMGAAMGVAHQRPIGGGMGGAPVMGGASTATTGIDRPTTPEAPKQFGDLLAAFTEKNVI